MDDCRKLILIGSNSRSYNAFRRSMVDFFISNSWRVDVVFPNIDQSEGSEVPVGVSFYSYSKKNRVYDIINFIKLVNKLSHSSTVIMAYTFWPILLTLAIKLRNSEKSKVVFLISGIGIFRSNLFTLGFFKLFSFIYLSASGVVFQNIDDYNACNYLVRKRLNFIIVNGSGVVVD